MGTTILSFSDRIVIETLRHEKRSLRYIADYLLSFSDILSGQLFFIPSRPLLEKIADGELNK